MDRDAFDALTRALAARASRRGWLAALGTAAVTAAALPGEAIAGKKSRKRRSRRRTQRRDDNETPPPCQGKDDGDECAAGKQCSGGICATPPACGGNASCIADVNCCSGSCLEEWFACDPSGAGQPCRSSFDCRDGLACAAFVCVS